MTKFGFAAVVASALSIIVRIYSKFRSVVGVCWCGQRGDRATVWRGFGYGAALAFSVRRAGCGRGRQDREGAWP